MKILCLNTWGGRLTEKLVDFLKQHTDVDVFCFQEVYNEAHGKDTIWMDTNFDLLNDLKKALPDYLCYYDPHLSDYWGLAMFVRKELIVLEQGEWFVHKHKGHNYEQEKIGHTAKNVQYVTLKVEDQQKLTIINFHGLWNGQGKGDSDDRIEQSRQLVEFCARMRNQYVLCGDFNLLPDSNSLLMFEEFGLRNLIKENNITSTRTSLYPKEGRFADYAFVAKGVDVKNFSVLPDEVSDHAPLLIEL
ncbi:MAG: endonuclease/exonuclease/phosphatase family protein [bacterium]